MPLVVLLFVPAAVEEPGLAAELESLEVGGGDALGGSAVVVSSFLLHAAVDRASATPIDTSNL